MAIPSRPCGVALLEDLYSAKANQVPTRRCSNSPPVEGKGKGPRWSSLVASDSDDNILPSFGQSSVGVSTQRPSRPSTREEGFTCYRAWVHRPFPCGPRESREVGVSEPRVPFHGLCSFGRPQGDRGLRRHWRAPLPTSANTYVT